MSILRVFGSGAESESRADLSEIGKKHDWLAEGRAPGPAPGPAALGIGRHQFSVAGAIVKEPGAVRLFLGAHQRKRTPATMYKT
jgi:hypothetical protein